MFGNGPLAAEVVLLLPSAAAVVYVTVVLHLIDTIRRLRPFERPEHWVRLSILWGYYPAGLAVLTARAMIGRVVHGERLVTEESSR